MAMTKNREVLAWLWGGYTILTNTVLLLGGLVFTMGCGPLLGLTGAPDAEALGQLAMFSGGVVLFVLMSTALSLSFCYGLHQGHRWGVWGILALALLNLFAIPLGTALAIFTFVALRDELGFGRPPE